MKYSVLMADSILELYPNNMLHKWRYDVGVCLRGIEQVYYTTKDKKYFDFIKKNTDCFITEDNKVLGYKIEEYNVDQIHNGKNVIFLYEQTNDYKYKEVAKLLRSQIDTHPRTNDGGLWHKKIYVEQMWLDGLYMAAAFMAQYAKCFSDDELFSDVIHQVKTMAKGTFDEKRGLYMHAYDHVKEQKWADSITGHSKNPWGRAMGWFACAIADILEYLPENRRGEILPIFNTVCEGIKKSSDKKTGMWYQVLDKGDEKGNYLETSCTSMFVYALLKGVKNGWIDASYKEVANKAYESMINMFVKEENGIYYLENCCEVAGLGGTPYRDGSYEYYISEPVIRNDFKAIGPFIAASVLYEEN